MKQRLLANLSWQNLNQFILIITIGFVLITNIRLIAVTSQLDLRLQQLSPGNSIIQQQGQASLANASRVDVEWEHAALRGSPDSPIRIVEFSDFQCPYCAISAPVLAQVLAQYPDTVSIAYRHYPLSGHAQAFPAAEAAECAREQDKFWEMHDQLFEHQEHLGTALYQQIAERIQLDRAQFDECMTTHRYQDRILEDWRAGQSYGVQSTPTFFVNGHPIRGAIDFQHFERVINDLLGANATK